MFNQQLINISKPGNLYPKNIKLAISNAMKKAQHNFLKKITKLRQNKRQKKGNFKTKHTNICSNYNSKAK